MDQQDPNEIANDIYERTSFLFGANGAFIEELYAQYQTNPESVDPSWRKFFAELGETRENAIAGLKQPAWKRADWPRPANGELVSALDSNWGAYEKTIKTKIAERSGGASEEEIRAATLDSIRAIMLIRAYRIRGHLKAKLDPLGIVPPTDHPELEPASYGFEEADMDRPIFIDYVLGMETATMRQIIEVVEKTYCDTIGVEFMHIADPEEKAWIQERIEGPDKEVSFTLEGKKAILTKLIEADAFETFLAKKYTGTKRFGLDGGESLIAALEQIIKRGGALGVKEIVIGMPHRGR
ncbi:MAG TPA: 2-oxoglutarate dehydrogenase E1 component, partial [Alphaproteobacteria bacterium]|nr:2-oxoglutarate dehydrogenase E1 component [Alphaproteobacteria bacterium]